MRRSAKALAVVAAAATTAGAVALPASAASFTTPSPAFTAGGVLHNGVYYAKSGKTLTLTVNTGDGTKCVQAGSAFKTNATAQTAWSFPVDTAASTVADGAQATALAAGNDWTNDKTGAVKECTRQTTSSTASYTLDNTKPSLSGKPKTSANGGGWYKSDVTIEWTAEDAGSGVTGNPVDSTVTGEGRELSVSTKASDRVGNEQSATSAKVNIDRTAPVTKTDASTVWNNVSQTVTLSPEDNLSGVASTFYKVGTADAVAGTSVTLESTGEHTLTYWSVDAAGNAETPKTATIKIDKTKPTIKHAVSPQPNLRGWNNSDATVRFTCGDEGGSGLKSCTGVLSDGTNDGITVTAEGESQTVTGTALDNAGNSVDDPAAVSLDRTKPTIDATDLPTSSAGWYKDDVTVDFKYTDGLSGITEKGDSSKTFGEGAGQSVRVSATDAAGNSRDLTVSGVNVDKTKPSTSSDAPTSWSKGDVTVALTGEDQTDLSGVARTEHRLKGQDTWATGTSVTFDKEGVHTLEFRSVDVAGNIEDFKTATISIDRTAPTVMDEGTTQLPGGTNGWYTSAVSNTFTAFDDDAGLADENQASFTKSSGTTQGSAVKISSGAVADTVSNSNDGIDSAEFKIDLTKPALPTFEGIAAAEYTPTTLPAAAAISCSSSDVTSGLKDCKVTGYGTTVGSHVLTATATDFAGHTNAETLTYTVKSGTWTLKGFYNPIGESNSIVKAPGEAAPTPLSTTPWNTAKGGSTVPLKFEAFDGGVERTSTGDIKSFNAQKLSSCTGAITEGIEELASAGSSSLRYDATDGQFIQNWKTSSVSTDTCFRVALTTTDGSAIYTFVRLRK